MKKQLLTYLILIAMVGSLMQSSPILAFSNSVNYYLDADEGDDTGDGSIEDPLKTIEEVYARIQGMIDGGDTLDEFTFTFREGEYQMPQSWPDFFQDADLVRFEGYDTLGVYESVTFFPETGSQAIFYMDQDTLGVPSVLDVKHIQFTGDDLTTSDVVETTPYGVYLAGENVDGDFGVPLTTEDLSWNNCTFDGFDDAIYLYNCKATGDTTIEDNSFMNISGHSILVEGYTNGSFLIEQNDIVGGEYGMYIHILSGSVEFIENTIAADKPLFIYGSVAAFPELYIRSNDLQSTSSVADHHVVDISGQFNEVALDDNDIYGGPSGDGTGVYGDCGSMDVDGNRIKDVKQAVILENMYEANFYDNDIVASLNGIKVSTNPEEGLYLDSSANHITNSSGNYSGTGIWIESKYEDLEVYIIESTIEGFFRAIYLQSEDPHAIDHTNARVEIGSPDADDYANHLGCNQYSIVTNLGDLTPGDDGIDDDGDGNLDDRFYIWASKNIWGVPEEDVSSKILEQFVDTALVIYDAPLDPNYTIEENDSVSLTQAGTIYDRNVQYQTAEEVINALPSSVEVGVLNGCKFDVPVTWADTDTYDATVAGNYTFTGTWGDVYGVDETTVAPLEVIVEVEQGTMKSMISYNPVVLAQTGTVLGGNVQYQTAAAVIDALPTDISVSLENDVIVAVPVTWTDTDTYDASVAAEYTFTATWGDLPIGVDNDESLITPIVEVAVAQGTRSSSSVPSIPSVVTSEKDIQEEDIIKNEDQPFEFSIETIKKGLVIDSKVFSLLAEKEKTFHIAFSDVTIGFDSEGAKKMRERYEEKDIVLRAEAVAGADLPNHTSYGQIYEIKMYYEEAGVMVPIQGEIELAFDFSDDVENPKMLGIYRWETDHWVYVGSEVDEVTGKIKVVLNHFSTYGVFEAPEVFDDVANHWAEEEIRELQLKGILVEPKDHFYHPNEAMNRLEIVKMMSNTLDLTVDDEDDNVVREFVDIAIDHPDYESIQNVAKESLVLGYEDGTFRPKKPVTREEMFAFVIRLYEELGGQSAEEDYTLLEVFVDNQDVSNWAKGTMAKAVSIGIAKGTPEKRLLPNAHVTRAEVNAIIKRIIDRLGL